MQQSPNSGSYVLQNAHSAGAQRGDPKTGDSGDYPYGNGPQGDFIRIYNYARCVRGGAEFVEVTDSGRGCGQLCPSVSTACVRAMGAGPHGD